MVTATVTFVALVLMITGVILKNALLLLTAFIPWIIFAFMMFGYTFANVAINTGLLLFGWFMAILCAIWALGIWTSRKPRQTSEDDYENYKKEVLKATRKR